MSMRTYCALKYTLSWLSHHDHPKVKAFLNHNFLLTRIPQSKEKPSKFSELMSSIDCCIVEMIWEWWLSRRTLGNKKNKAQGCSRETVYGGPPRFLNLIDSFTSMNTFADSQLKSSRILGKIQPEMQPNFDRPIFSKPKMFLWFSSSSIQSSNKVVLANRSSAIKCTYDCQIIYC